MSFHRFKRRLLAAAVALPLAVSAASAAELVIPTLDYRTGPFAPNGIPFANGFTDYMNMLNARDGGIGGVPIRLVACETAYNTKQGVECYEKTKDEGENGALVYQPLSTGITYQLIPKAAVDEVPIFSMGVRPDVGHQWEGVPLGIQFPCELLGPGHRVCAIHR